MIEGYASAVSVQANDTLDFHVRAAAAQSHFTMDVYRRGVSDTLVKTCEADAFVPGPHDDAALAVDGCGWPASTGCRTVVPAE